MPFPATSHKGRPKMRLGLFGSAAPRVARRLAAEPQIEQRDLPPVMPPAWLVDKARAQGVDPMLEWQAMGGGSMPTAPVAPANNPMPSSVPPMGMFGGARKKAMTAASSLPPMAPQPSPQPVQPQVKGGMQMAAVDQASRPQQLGAFGNGPAQAAKPAGLWDEVWADPFTFFMTGTDGLDRKYGRVAEQAVATQAQQQKAELEAMIRALPPEQQMLWRTNPEEMSKQLASNYAAANVGAGETRYLGGKGETFTAPKFGFEGATPYAQTFGDGRLTTTYGDNRPKSYAEATDEATLAETGRSNRADEALGRDRLGLDRSKFQFERDNPGAANGGLTPYQQIQVDRQLAGDKAKTDAATATARTSITNIQEGQTRVQALLDHPGFEGIYGNVGLGNAKPTFAMDQDELNAVALLDQIGGEAFLAGVEKMRGTGPLSDNEGKRVMQAVTRLTNRLQDPASATAAAQEFMASLQRLEEAVAQESSLQDMVPRLAQAQAAERERAARQSHSGAILGGTGQFNPAAFQGLAPSAADMADDELRAMLGLD